MEGNATTTIAIVGVLATCVGGLLWIIKFLFNQLLPRLDVGNVILEKLTVATQENTTATKNADKYLQERNGRDNEMHAEMIKAINAIPEQIIKTATVTAKVLAATPVEQHIGTQKVETQVVREKK